MECQKCKSERILDINGKTSDCFCMNYKGKDYDGYVLDEVGIGGGDYIEFKYCLDCGQIQGTFPIKEEVVMKEIKDSYVDEDEEEGN